jgi:O-antigen/teichoic acid export membrane protein
MIEKIVKLGKEAAVYGLSSILGRFINFLLVPLYTNFLLPSEYGVIATLYSYIAFVAILYGFGMEAAFMRYVASLEIGDEKQNFSTPHIFLALSSLLLSATLHVAASPVAALIDLGPHHADLVRYAAWILCLDTLAIIPYASLRMKNRALTFALIRLGSIVLNVLLFVALVVGMGLRAEGVLAANLGASALTVVVLLPHTLRQLTHRLSLPLFRQLLKFGLPYVPAGLAAIAMQVIDRPILKALTNDATVGIYQANYRLGIFMMLVVGMFDYAWRPFFLQHAREPDARTLFSRVFTYFSVFALGLFLLVSMVVPDLVRIRIAGSYFFHPDYWAGTHIVPWILLGYVFNGAYVNFVIGVYLEKKTKYVPLVTGAGALSNVAANLLLVPSLGMLGAAIATLVSYVVIAAGIYAASQRLYRVDYEWPKILKVALLTAVLFAGFLLLDPEPATVGGIGLKLLLMGAFVVLVYVSRVIHPSELVGTVAAVRETAGVKAPPPDLPPERHVP